MDGYLGIGLFETVDFDVFLNQPGYFPYAFCKSDRRCNHHEVYSYITTCLQLFVRFLLECV